MPARSAGTKVRHNAVAVAATASKTGSHLMFKGSLTALATLGALAMLPLGDLRQRNGAVFLALHAQPLKRGAFWVGGATSPTGVSAALCG